jgi:hypothetical protein
LSPQVLGAATLVSSPALWLGLVDQTLPIDVALTRYLVALVLCWAALSLVATWAFPDPGPAKVERDAPAEPRREQEQAEPAQ